MGEERSPAFYWLAAFFGLFVLFLYGPMIVIFILSFQGPTGGLTFPMNGVSLHWFERLWKGSAGGFGGVLLLAHNWADWPATKRSYELMARYVHPNFQRNANELRDSSYNDAKAKYATAGAQSSCRSGGALWCGTPAWTHAGNALRRRAAAGRPRQGARAPSPTLAMR